ncbi:hypothetical protein ACHAXA_011690 [Cyclostephanos tholiformis]|uniref:Uncharacterized protein n=1 Tax=Cyclostephanos tholiformis TaxID=382380 RepID=A0ABD3SCM7_9STRA
MTRPEYLAAQIDTWASHVDVRNYWGFTELDDYDPNCSNSSIITTRNSREYVDAIVRDCRSPSLWRTNVDDHDDYYDDGGFEKFQELRTINYGRASGKGTNERDPGWFCAQRRHGRALGWLRSIYLDTSSSMSMSLPDLLLVVDDDTSLDIEKVKHLMRSSSNDDASSPHVGATCTFRAGYIDFAFGGYGTFLNRASIERMTTPIHCDDDDASSSSSSSSSSSAYVESVCANLKRNRVGERDSFRDGDTIFDVFYRYSARTDFCMHSDWAFGYMISLYSGGGGIHQLWRPGGKCGDVSCTLESVACHNHGPDEMLDFHRSRNPVSDDD